MANPKLSVLLPIHNGIEFYPDGMLKKSIDSVLSLDVDLELIMINDGSTDNTMEIIEEYYQKDKRVHKVTYGDNHLGQAKALTAGILMVTGQYIWQYSVRAEAQPGVAGMVKALDDNPDIGFVCGQMYSWGTKDRIHTPPPYDRQRYIDRYYSNFYMYRKVPGLEYRDYMPTPDGRVIGITDRDMLMQLIGRGAKGMALRDTLVVNYYNGGWHTMSERKKYGTEIDAEFHKRWGHLLI